MVGCDWSFQLLFRAQQALVGTLGTMLQVPKGLAPSGPLLGIMLYSVLATQIPPCLLPFLEDPWHDFGGQL